MNHPVKFYTDVHVDRKAVKQLKNKGVDIIHCSEVRMEEAADEAHLAYATELGRIIVSCDEDFSDLHFKWQSADREHAGIVCMRMFDQCKSISFIVNTILFLNEAAVYKTDLYNRIWRP